MSSIIYVDITIDTDGVIRNYPSPSQDQNSPTGLAHTYQYMVVSGNDAISGQGTGDLNFQAEVGDSVRMTMQSASGNMVNPCIIYDVERFSGPEILGAFQSFCISTPNVTPGSPDPLPPSFGQGSFCYYQGVVLQPGTEGYRLQFAMYQKQQDGSLALLGYFYWDPTITVAS